MDQIQFNRKYKGIKMHKYVPLLENQVKEEITRRKDWMEKCFEFKDEIKDLIHERRYLLFLIILLVLSFSFNTIMMIILRGIQ